MGLKGWLHVLAALLGLALAGLIVFIVFGQASEQGQVAGEAPEEASRCGSIAPARVRESDAIEAAREALPPVVNEKGTRIRVEADEQAWLAQVHAASGLCVERFVIRPNLWTVQTKYPQDVDRAQLEAYGIETLARAFEPPLRQPRVQLDTTVGSERRSAVVRGDAWNAFQQQRGALGIERSIRGLARFSQVTTYDRRFIQVSGW